MTEGLRLMGETGNFMAAAASVGRLSGVDRTQLAYWCSETERKCGMAEGDKVAVDRDVLHEAVSYLREYYMSNVWRGEDKVMGGLSKLKSVADALAASER